MAYNPGTNIVISGKTFTDVPSVQFKTPDGSTVNFAHVGGQIRFSPTLEEQTQDVANYEDVIIDPITSTLLNQLDSDFVAENIKKGVDLFGLLGTLEGGGGNVTCKIGTVTPEADISLHNSPYTIQHNLGRIPKAFFIYASSRDVWGSDIYSVLFAFGFEIDAGGIPTVITSGYYSEDDSTEKFQNAVLSYEAGYKKNNTLQTAKESTNNASISIYAATEEIIKINYVIKNGRLKGGWTYTWIAI